MKKLFGFLIFTFTMVSFMFKTAALQAYGYDDWYSQNGYGSKQKVTDNITNLNGKYDDDMGMYVGPYSKKSKDKLKDGINEELNVEIDFDKMKTSELFEITLGLQNSDNVYVSEAVVTTQKISDNEVKLSATWAPSFSYVLKENGIYTYQWKMFIRNGVTYVNFTILDYGKELKSTGDINLDKIITSDTKTPIANEKDVSVKYLWFCNIKMQDGINVYTVLPEKNVVNPNTFDNVTTYFSLTFVSLIFISLFALKKERN